MTPLCTVVLATSNDMKAAELRSLLGDLPVEFATLADVLGQRPVAIPEDGRTFEANAEQKARIVSEFTGMVTIGDDSGLEVEALDGRPGVRSARFAHDRATDAENNAELLRALEDVEDGARVARFRCALALANPWAGTTIQVVVGQVDGEIARTPRGAGGFGYDPLFVLRGDRRALAELTDQERVAVSHRGRAVEALRPVFARSIQGMIEMANRLAR